MELRRDRRQPSYSQSGYQRFSPVSFSRGAAILAVVVLATSACQSARATAKRSIDAPASSTTEPEVDGTSATLPSRSAFADAIDEVAIRSRVEPALFAVVARGCTGDDWSAGTAFAIGGEFLITAWSVIAQDQESEVSPVDPRPWVRGSDWKWQRADVLGVDATSGVAVLKLPAAPAASLEWSASPVPQDAMAVLASFPALRDGAMATAPAVIGAEAQVGTNNEAFNYSLGEGASPGVGDPGAPILDPDGKVMGIHLASVDGSAVQRVALAGVQVQSALGTIRNAPAYPPNACDADAPERAPMGWGFVLDPTGGESRRAQLAAAPDMPDGLSVAVVSADYAPFLRPGSTGAVVIGSFDTPETTAALADQVRQQLGEPTDIAPTVDLYPRAVFAAQVGVGPAETTSTTAVPPLVAPTTVPPTAPPTEAPTTAATTAPVTKKSTTSAAKTTAAPTTAANTSGGCPPPGAGTRVVMIRNGTAGLFDSPGGNVTSYAQEGYYITAVLGSRTGGYTMVVDGGRCLWVKSDHVTGPG